MCRNIKQLYNFDPPATDEEIQNASIQFVRKISGMQKPSTSNQEIFDDAVEEINLVIKKLLEKLPTTSNPKNRDVEREKARLRNEKRFGS